MVLAGTAGTSNRRKVVDFCTLRYQPGQGMTLQIGFESRRGRQFYSKISFFNNSRCAGYPGAFVPRLRREAVG